MEKKPASSLGIDKATSGIGAFLVSMVTMVSPVSACAADLAISATIAKKAELQTLARPAVLEITAADVERGYIDVPSIAQFSVRSNSPSGYLLVFDTQGDFISGTQVSGLSRAVQLGGAGGSVAQPSTRRGYALGTLDLGFRFTLSTSARAGVHAWPLQVSVIPL